ncbi:MAG: hypothetical protein KAS48_08505 [Gammaproteobacteria bacterium]|nr:hypothetical protein [Gammaproteobacteria bacterium]
MTDEREKFLKKLEHLGEEDVRQKHAENHFGPQDSKRSAWTLEWLKGKEKEVAVKQSNTDEESEKDAQPEIAAFSPVDLDARRKKAVKTVIMVGIVSLLIFLYMLYSGI